MELLSTNMDASRKGQSSIEFLILVSGVVFFLIIFMIAIQNNIADKTSQQRDLIVKEIALTIRDEIALAHNSINGYSRTFNIPTSVAGRDYTAEVVEGFVFIATEDGKHAIAFPIFEVSGEVFPGDNNITKQKGAVCLNTGAEDCG